MYLSLRRKQANHHLRCYLALTMSISRAIGHSGRLWSEKLLWHSIAQYTVIFSCQLPYLLAIFTYVDAAAKLLAALV